MQQYKFVYRFSALFISVAIYTPVSAQSLQDQYQLFKDRTISNYSSFRDDCNKKYAQFLLSAWSWYESKAPLPVPEELTPVPPRPYNNEDARPIEVTPIDVNPIDNELQPLPLEPIREVPSPQIDGFKVGFYGVTCSVRLPECARLCFKNCTPDIIANAWEVLATDSINNAIRDCLEMRIRYNLCDWAYLQFLDRLCTGYCADKNGATMLMAFLYCQSGYQMRLAVDGSNLIMLYGSKHQIFNKGYFDVGGIYFYPYGEPSNNISICNAEFECETPMSLLINAEQKLGMSMSAVRAIKSKQYADVSISSQVPNNLIDFYNSYPTSAIDNNPMTRWAMYANTPLAQKSKDLIYPALRKAISGCDALAAANKLLNWVQTGFVYEYDDKVWGYDRAFFAEETLYYPYCDCEDRAILFSRIVRDLLDLDVALIYYPGHLATAVCFNDDIRGDAMIINGRKFIVCDPTYIGAPVGAQMPDLEYDKAEAILLDNK
jgi:hypothetical protein